MFVLFQILYAERLITQTGNYDDMALEKMPDGSSHPYLYKGDGDLSFKDVSNDWGTARYERILQRRCVRRPG